LHFAGADREAYYYGREKLFQSHPDIISVLCRYFARHFCHAGFYSMHSEFVECLFIFWNIYLFISAREVMRCLRDDRECPSLLEETFFDGLMWHSKDVDDGQIRVNYYISEMYGDPCKDLNSNNNAMSILVAEGNSAMFAHPVTSISKAFVQIT
jgi:hypothetical protein